MGVGAAVGTAIAGISASIGGAVAAGATAIGVGAATAASIGAIAGPALLGAGIGAIGSAITGGNPLIGAALGGLTGGLGGAGAGAAVGGALGIGASGGTALLGAGVGALGAGLTGGNPLLGAVTGGVGGYLSGGGLGEIGGALSGPGNAFGGATMVPDGAAVSPVGSAAASGGVEGGTWDVPGASGGSADIGGALSMADNSNLNPSSRFTGAMSSDSAGSGGGSWLKRQFDAVTGNDANATTNPTGRGPLVNADGSIVTPPIPPQLDANGNPVYAGGALQYGDGSQAFGDAAALHDAQSTAGYVDTAAGKGATSESGGGIASWLGKNPSLILGALSGISSLFNKPTVSTQPTPGPAQNSNWSNPAYSNALQPLNPNYPGRTAVTPAVNYYTYGQVPGGAQFFKNNSLKAYGFARGGALSAANDGEFRTSTHDRHVQGPGTETSDDIPAMLSRNEYVLDANDVRAIGGGSNARGARILDRERKKLTRSGGGALSMLARRAA